MGEREIRTCEFRPQRSSLKRESDSDRNVRFASTTVFEEKIETESERRSRLISVLNGLQRRGLESGMGHGPCSFDVPIQSINGHPVTHVDDLNTPRPP